jgi:hypothetical protein
MSEPGRKLVAELGASAARARDLGQPMACRPEIRWFPESVAVGNT